jgi:hypothetical protein
MKNLLPRPMKNRNHPALEQREQMRVPPLHRDMEMGIGIQAQLDLVIRQSGRERVAQLVEHHHIGVAAQHRQIVERQIGLMIDRIARRRSAHPRTQINDPKPPPEHPEYPVEQVERQHIHRCLPPFRCHLVMNHQQGPVRREHPRAEPRPVVGKHLERRADRGMIVPVRQPGGPQGGRHIAARFIAKFDLTVIEKKIERAHPGIGRHHPPRHPPAPMQEMDERDEGIDLGPELPGEIEPSRHIEVTWRFIRPCDDQPRPLRPIFDHSGTFAATG